MGSMCCCALQEYFFPKEKTGDDEQASKRRETWRKNMDGKLRSKRSSAASEAGAALPAHDLTGLKLGRPDGSKSAVTTPQVMSMATGDFPVLHMISGYCKMSAGICPRWPAPCDRGSHLRW